MGLEASYQAIPAHSPFLDRLRADLRTEGMANLILREIQRGQGLPRRPHSTEPVDFAIEQYLLEMFDVRDVSAHHFTLDRAWDTMHYCLSALRREEAGTADDELMDVAIRGEETIAAHLVALQGEPLMQTSPETVKRIARHLETLSFDTLLLQFGPRLLHGEQYKGPSPESREQYCEELRERFAGFRAFYQAAAFHGDRVLMVLD